MHLECLGYGIPNNLTYKWYKNDELILNLENDNNRIKIQVCSSLKKSLFFDL